MTEIDTSTIVSARVIVEHGYDIAMVRRASNGEFAGAWEVPGGKQNPAEEIWEAAAREATEELGLNGELDFVLYDPVFVEERVILDGKHKGRPYKAFGFLATTSSRIMTLDPTEHCDGQWLPPADALKLPGLSPTSFRTITALGSMLARPLSKA